MWPAPPRLHTGANEHDVDVAELLPKRSCRPLYGVVDCSTPNSPKDSDDHRDDRTAAHDEDVARAAGVSRAAVSKVIRDAYGVSPAMRERVNTAIDTLGYRPRISARGMRGSTFTLGIEIPDFFNPFFQKVVAGATAALSGGPYQLVIAPADPAHADGSRAIQGLADRQVDGVVAVSPMVDPEWLEELAARLPLVMLGRHDKSRNYDTIVGDDAAGTRMAMEHLLDLGHRNIAHLTLHDEITQCHPARHTGSAWRPTGR